MKTHTLYMYTCILYITLLQAQAEEEALRLREQVEMKQKQRALLQANVSPPRKKWAVPATPLSIAQGDATTIVSESMLKWVWPLNNNIF